MNRYTSDVYVSWEELHRDTRTLCTALLDRGPWDGIVAISRGGLIPAAIVARELEVRMVDTICVLSYRGDEAQEQLDEAEILKRPSIEGERLLLIDDLVDTGKTASAVREVLPDAFFATVYAKPEGREMVDLCIREVSQETWIRFPWDTALSFTPPLVDRSESRSS